MEDRLVEAFQESPNIYFDTNDLLLLAILKLLKLLVKKNESSFDSLSDKVDSIEKDSRPPVFATTG